MVTGVTNISTTFSYDYNYSIQYIPEITMEKDLEKGIVMDLLEKNPVLLEEIILEIRRRKIKKLTTWKLHQ